MPEPGVSVAISGREFSGWEEIRIRRALDSFSTIELSAPFEPNNPDFRETFKPFSYQPIEVRVGGERVFSEGVDARGSWQQDGAGAHVNVSTAAVTANAANPDEALALIEWLATDGQAKFASANFEYPADPAVASADVLAAFGSHTSDEAAVRELGGLNAAAVDLLAAAGYE